MECNPTGAMFEGLGALQVNGGPMGGGFGGGEEEQHAAEMSMQQYQAALHQQQQQQQHHMDPHLAAQFQQAYQQQQQQQHPSTSPSMVASSASAAPPQLNMGGGGNAWDMQHQHQQMAMMQHQQAQQAMLMMMGGAGNNNFQQQHNFMQQQHHQQQFRSGPQQQAPPLPSRPSDSVPLPQLPSADLFGAAASGPQEFDWASKFSGGGANEGHMTDAELAGNGVQTLGTLGQEPLTVEQKAEASAFNKLMGEINSGEAYVDETAGAINRVAESGEDTSEAAQWAKQLAEAQKNVDSVFGPDGTLDPSQLTNDEKFLRELESGQGDLEGNDPSSQGFYDSEFAFGGDNMMSNDGAEYPQQMYQDGGDLAASAEASAMASKWDRENLRRGEEGEALGMGEGEGDEGVNEFDGDANEWVREYQEALKHAENKRNSTDYPFDTDNPYLFHGDPYSEGMQLLEVGAVAEAVLSFEAACQQKDSRQEAWRQLGLSQAENEKDGMAIMALNKARELDGRDVHTHMALAVSHANEANYTLALDSLKNWLFSHQEYEALQHVSMEEPAEVARNAAAAVSSSSATAGIGLDDDFEDDVTPAGYQNLFLQPAQIQQVTNLFHAASEINPQDHDVHVCLGIVGCLAHDYQMGIDNFQRAVEIQPNDARVWNKLGATLANGNRSEEAIEAYNHALDINPGYVRARHNMGVAFNNLGDHAAAAKHLVQAIHMQQGGTDDEQATVAGGSGGDGAAAPPRRPRSTREMWDVLRMSLNLMRRQDLVERSWTQDIRPFMQEFGLEMH